MKHDPDWTRHADRLERAFEFDDFSAAFGFLSRVALAAEKADHHPEIVNSWNKVRLTLTTHDAGSTVTQKDEDMARTIDGLIG